MRATLSSYTLVGLDAVPVGVVVDGDQLRVVEPETGRTLHSVTLDRTESERPIPEHIVNTSTYPVRNLAPGRLAATNSAHRISCYL